jgi:ubiquitin C-terminal hydrolase
MSDIQNEPDPSLKGVVGIDNMGNTCYSNSTVQLLRACSEWNIFCLTRNFNELLAHLPDTNNNKRILIAYQDMLRSLWSAYRPSYVRPNGFVNEIRTAVRGTLYESFGYPIPNDSHEFLVYLLDNFHEALKRDIDIKEEPINENDSDSLKMEKMATNGWNKFISKNMSEIVQLFFGMMRKTVRCIVCGTNVYQWEVFNTIKIRCEGETFDEWIKNEVNSTSHIDGYNCDKCKYRTTAIIQSHLWRLPECLFITICRFNYDNNKNMTMCPYSGNNMSFNEFFSKDAPNNMKHGDYELRGISDHHGAHLGGGHYTAQFKHPITNEWWGFDDSQSHKLNGPMMSPSNYIFLFRKR